MVAEVERYLPEQARERTRAVEPAMAVARWRTMYAPYVRVVDVPDSWGASDPNVQAVARVDADDVPLARLAFALARSPADSDHGRADSRDTQVAMCWPRTRT